MTRFRETLTPAYGRDYNSKKAIIEDLKADRDFAGQPSGRYINLPQLIEGKFTEITVRYANQRKVCVIKITKEGALK